ncbi:hypothetical protein GTY20_09135 [Streptomyces sp. SID4946]|uniref:hypothetical protein n=1 Tax=Streptomyces sp. LamerLS-31b TaxID=1839765 RepID=UPI00081E4CD2|nr:MULTISPECIES: hypothetical protein [unclassified Streptomyces]MYQ91480.1 hypothetical protein [Streptomyces sp. SID4946]SCF67822.1 hypothetical protein GA0115256_111333 [Streptomyces sp. DconLS]SCF75545.1 hypothetical protein GA0115258_11164 [Streptomyces sp. LamerLS-31b]
MSENTASPVVRFHPAVGSERAYDFAPLPCPPLHAPLAAAFEARLAPAIGGMLTRASADTYFATIRRFLAFLSMQDKPLTCLADVQPDHLHTYRDVEGATRSTAGIAREIAQLCRLLQDAPYGSVNPAVWDLIKTPRNITGPQPPRNPVPLYSLREYSALLEAARTDAARTIARITASEQLLAAFRTAPDTLCEQELATARLLDVMDRTGRIPHTEGRRKQDTARLLFLTPADAAPLFVLAMAASRLRVSETADLPGQHVVDNGDVIVRISQHKTGPLTCRWAIRGEGHDPLDSAGDLYLLLHRLTERSRRFSATPQLWNLWTGRSANLSGHTPLSRNSASPLLNTWAHRHQLTADDGRPLTVQLHRLRATAKALADRG